MHYTWCPALSAKSISLVCWSTSTYRCDPSDRQPFMKAGKIECKIHTTCHAHKSTCSVSLFLHHFFSMVSSQYSRNHHLRPLGQKAGRLPRSPLRVRSCAVLLSRVTFGPPSVGPSTFIKFCVHTLLISAFCNLYEVILSVSRL